VAAGLTMGSADQTANIENGSASNAWAAFHNVTDTELNPAKYLSFSATPEAGKTIELSHLTISTRQAGTQGARFAAVATSADNYTSRTIIELQPEASNEVWRFNLAGLTLTDTTGIRVYAWGAQATDREDITSTAGGGSGISLFGTVLDARSGDSLDRVIELDSAVAGWVNTATATLRQTLATGVAAGDTLTLRYAGATLQTYTLTATDVANGYADITFAVDSSTRSLGSSAVRTALDGANGFSFFNTATFNTTSSIRFKENIRPLSGAMEIINSIQGVRFDWKTKDLKDDIGFIAEEMFKVVPSIVGHDIDGLINGLEYGKITALSIEAIKEIDKRLKELENRR
jgi:hypothetical protein